MRIQLTTTHLSGKKDTVSQRWLSGQIMRISAVPGGITALEIDGRPVSGSTPIKGALPTLQRQADDLLIMVDDQALVIINDFFIAPGADLQGADWVFDQAAGSRMADACAQPGGTAAASSACLTDTLPGSRNHPYTVFRNEQAEAIDTV